MTRPRRYPRDVRLSSIVDQLLVIEEELGDDPENAARLRQARWLVGDVAMGVKR